MPRIRITTLTDKMKDEQVLSKLKSIGAKTKDKEKTGAEESHEETKEKLSATGEKISRKTGCLDGHQKTGAGTAATATGTGRRKSNRRGKTG